MLTSQNSCAMPGPNPSSIPYVLAMGLYPTILYLDSASVLLLTSLTYGFVHNPRGPRSCSAPSTLETHPPPAPPEQDFLPA